MSNIINLQLSVFCNKHIEPTSEKITAIMSKINSLSGLMFLPSIVNGQNIDILAKKVTNVSNLAFITSNQHVQILCTDNRIDIIFNKNVDTALNYEKHLAMAESLLTFIMNEETITGNRLALNTQIISAENIENIADIISKYGKPLSFYESKPVEEWLLRYNSRETVDMAGITEIINAVTNLSIVQNVDRAEKCILCHVDINTLAENIVPRFSSRSVSFFTTAIEPIVESIKTSFVSIENDK